MLNSMENTGFLSRYYANTVYFLSGLKFMIFIGEISTFTLDIVQDSFFFYFLHFMAEDIKGIQFISCLTYFDVSTIVVAQVFIGLFWLVKHFENRSKSCSFWVGLFMSPCMAPFLPYVYMTRRAINDDKAGRIVDHWLDQNHNEGHVEIYLKYKATMEAEKDIKQTDITIHQIICNFENLPQIVLLMSFLSVSFVNKYGDSGIELNIMPRGKFKNAKYWLSFILSLCLSCYNAMSSFLESTNILKLDQPGIFPKLLLTISFALQIVSRIGPTTVICIMKIYADAKAAVSPSDSDYDIPLPIVFCMLLLPVFIRWGGTFCIYKWFASAETRQRYDKLGGFFRGGFVHICTNTFMINPVRSEKEEDSDKIEHFLLSVLPFLDSAFYFCFWFVLPASCKNPFLMLLLILPIAGSLLGGFFLWMYYRTVLQ